MQELKDIINDIRIGALPGSALPQFIAYQISKNIAWISVGMVLGFGISIIVR